MIGYESEPIRMILIIGYSFRTILKFKIKFQFQSSKMEKKYLLFKALRRRWAPRHKVTAVILACLSVQKIYQPIRINLQKRKKSKGKFRIQRKDLTSNPGIHGPPARGPIGLNWFIFSKISRSWSGIDRGFKPFILETKLIM